MLAYSLAALAFTASAAAVPAVKRFVSSCDGLGSGAFDTAYNFTLAAYNTTLSNANTTGVPLVLGQNGAIDGAEFEVFSTYASYPYNEWTQISLVNGRLFPTGPHVLPATGMSVADGGKPSFAVSSSVDPETGAQIYCAVAPTDPDGHSTGYVSLAVNGKLDAFSLCTESATRQNNVVFRATNATTNSQSCYPVKLQLVFTET